MATTRWTPIYLTAAVIMGAILVLILWAVPVDDEGVRDWTGQLIPGFWMAWTFPVALFFWCIAGLLIVFTLLAVRIPETPRVGVLRIETTRGDRLFITLGLHPSWLAFLRRPRPDLGRGDPFPRLRRSGLSLGLMRAFTAPGRNARPGEDDKKTFTLWEDPHETTSIDNCHGACADGHERPGLGGHRGGESLP
jgi:predicted small integral membrane protein